MNVVYELSSTNPVNGTFALAVPISYYHDEFQCRP